MGARVVHGRALNLYATTGDAVAVLSERDGGWSVEVSLAGSGAQCIARGEQLLVGCRGGGVHASADGRSWRDLELPDEDVYSVAVSPAVRAHSAVSAVTSSESGTLARSISSE